MNGVSRKGTLAVIQETSYGTTTSGTEFVLPVVELTMEEVVNYAENNSMIGSTYEVNDAEPDTYEANVTIRFKLDENIFPLFLKNKFTDVATPVVGDTDVIDHVWTYNNSNTGTSFTLKWDDPDRTDLTFAGFVPETIVLQPETNNYVMVEVSGRSKYPEEASHSLTVAAFREFVSRNMGFQLGTASGSLQNYELQTATMTHTFTLADSEVNIPLGSSGPTKMLTTSDRFELEANALMPDLVTKNYNRYGTELQSELSFTDTGRIVSGSTTNLNPYVKFTYPSMKAISWARSGGADDIVSQDMTLLALDKIGVADTPVVIEIRNNVASY